MKKVLKTGIALLLAAALLGSLAACGPAESREGLGNGWEPLESMELQFATEFSVDYYEGGYKLLSIHNGGRFLVIPEGQDCPRGIAGDIVPLYQPLENIYLAASATMCLFDALDRLDVITLSGIREKSWHIPNAAKAMQEGRMLYAGKYSEPDYEMLMAHRCPLAIENTMIGHASDVQDKLEELGLAVIVEMSSMESHPLGRTEWIKFFAALIDEEEKAEAIFNEQVEHLNAVLNGVETGKTVSFFHISSAGYVVARKSSDYVSKMIELAGADYVFSDLGDPESKKATVNLEMETFYAAAKDADYMIYNSTIGGEVHSMEDLLAKSPLLAEFKAVKEGNVWCTEKNMYQETTRLGEMIESFRMIFTGEADELDEVPFLYRIR